MTYLQALCAFLTTFCKEGDLEHYAAAQWGWGPGETSLARDTLHRLGYAYEACDGDWTLTALGASNTGGQRV